jgi:hypothetical protein
MTTRIGFYPFPSRGRSRTGVVDAKYSIECALTRRGLTRAIQINPREQFENAIQHRTHARATRSDARKPDLPTIKIFLRASKLDSRRDDDVGVL